MTLSLLAAGGLASGCSSGTSTSNVNVGTPAFTDVNGAPLKTPLKSLNSGQSAYLEVTLSNDPQLLGADWSVYCGSAPPPGTPPPPGQTQDQSCGTFSPGHTMSGPVPSYLTNASGYVTLYTAPAAPPAQGTVTLYAVATSNPSRWSSVTLNVIGLPISVSFAPPPPASLAPGATTTIKAVVNNDAGNAGVVWTTICGSADCGSFDPAKSASGGVTSYTAPATVPQGGTVQVIATSVTDPTKSASATISIAAPEASGISGRVITSLSPVSGAEVSLYAIASASNKPASLTSKGEGRALATTTSGEDGSFSFDDEIACPAPGTQLYLLARSGDAGAGNNPGLVLASAIGSCSNLSSRYFVINEATTVASIYALSAFLVDEAHAGSSQTEANAVAAAVATGKELVDPITGVVVVHSTPESGVIPSAKINTIAGLITACARTAGPAPGDGSPCDELSHAAGAQATNTLDTFEAILSLARHPASLDAWESEKLYALASTSAATGPQLGPMLSSAPEDWSLAIIFPSPENGRSTGSGNSQADAAGNIWLRDGDGRRIEFVGGASYAGIDKIVARLTAALEGAH